LQISSDYQEIQQAPACSVKSVKVGQDVRRSVRSCPERSHRSSSKFHRLVTSIWLRSDACSDPPNSSLLRSQGVNLEELVDDVKKLKATVRKLTRRVSALEKQLGEVIADEVLGDDGEEE